MLFALRLLIAAPLGFLGVGLLLLGLIPASEIPSDLVPPETSLPVHEPFRVALTDSIDQVLARRGTLPTPDEFTRIFRDTVATQPSLAVQTRYEVLSLGAEPVYRLRFDVKGNDSTDTPSGEAFWTSDERRTRFAASRTGFLTERAWTDTLVLWSLGMTFCLATYVLAAGIPASWRVRRRR